MRSAREVPVVAHELPGFSAVVGAPELSAFDFLALFAGNPIRGLDESVDAVRARGSDSDGDLSHGKLRKAASFESFPGVAAVLRHPNAAPGAAARPAPAVDF